MKIQTNHISIGSQSGNLYSEYLLYIRNKYGDAFVDNPPFEITFEDIFQGWLKAKESVPQDLNDKQLSNEQITEDIDYEEIKPKLLGEM